MPGSVFYTPEDTQITQKKSLETLDQILSSGGKTFVVLAATALEQLDKTVELAVEKEEA